MTKMDDVFYSNKFFIKSMLRNKFLWIWNWMK